jgi:hypothetical protein
MTHLANIKKKLPKEQNESIGRAITRYILTLYLI